MSDWEEDEWHRRVDPIVDIIYEHSQEDFFEEYDIGEELNKYRCLSALYILFCNQKNLKQNTKIFKAWVKIHLRVAIFKQNLIYLNNYIFDENSF